MLLRYYRRRQRFHREKYVDIDVKIGALLWELRVLRNEDVHPARKRANKRINCKKD